MRAPDKNSTDNKLITALFNGYVRKSKMTAEQKSLYYRVISLLISNKKKERTELIDAIETAGIMSPKLKSIIVKHFPKPFQKKATKAESKA